MTPWKGKTVIQTTNMFLHVWLVAGAKTVDEAQGRFGDVIKGDILTDLAERSIRCAAFVRSWAYLGQHRQGGR